MRWSVAFVAGLVARAPRRRVSIPARLRAGGAPVSVCIRDISPRSMLIEGEAAPPTGTYVEIVGTDASLTGQVIWSSGARFAVRTRERLNVKATAAELRGLRLSAVETHAIASAKPGQSFGAARGNSADRAERSRILGRRIEHVAIVTCVIVAATVVAGAAYWTLNRSFAAVTAHVLPRN
jgi:hypothetical protein